MISNGTALAEITILSVSSEGYEWYLPMIREVDNRATLRNGLRRDPCPAVSSCRGAEKCRIRYAIKVDCYDFRVGALGRSGSQRAGIVLPPPDRSSG